MNIALHIRKNFRKRNRVPAIRACFGILLFLCTVTIASAQNPVFFERITTDNGLSQSDINTIYQDEDGFLWFATHDGLNKYDGYDFTIYNPDSNNPNSISSNLIYNIVGDKSGNLWIGTTGSGLNYFDRATEKFTQYRHDKNNPKSINSDHITTLFRDSQDKLWIGTRKGLNMLDLQKSRDTVEIKRFTAQQEPLLLRNNVSSVNTIFEDKNGQLWIGGYGGIYRLSREQNGDIYVRFMSDLIGLPNLSVGSIGQDNNGRLVIGTEKGLYYQSARKDSLKVQKIMDGHFNDLLFDNKSNIWAGLNNGLLYFKNNPDNEFPELANKFLYDPRNPNSLSKNIVTSLLMDKTGIIWVGTNGGGVNKFDPERKQFKHLRKTLDPKSLSYDKVRAFFEDSNGTLWVGTEGGGLNMLNKDKKEFEHLETISKLFVIIEIKDGAKKKLLIGGESTPGLFELDITHPGGLKENDLVPIPGIDHSVFSLLVDSEKNIWIGTYNGGLYRWIFKPEDGSYSKQMFISDPNDPRSISNDIIRHIQEDRHGNIWFATADGLNRLSQKETLKKYPKFDVFKNVVGDANSISHDYILPIYESLAGDLWIGTFGGGLNKYIPATDDSPSKFKFYSEKDGLPNNVIKGILEDDDGRLWLSTNKGLSRFDPKLEVFKNYDVNDGLQSNEFQELACLKRKNGEMLFGGVNGYNSFCPKDLRENTFEAETVITNLSIMNKSIGVGEKINGRVVLEKNLNDQEEFRLKHWENSISFDFAALHYAAPQKNKFAYKLDGFDEDWIYTTTDKRYAAYTNLEPGKYTLHVKASNNDGVWDTSPSQLHITIVPPFWRTNMAYVFYALFFLALLGAFRKYTIISTTKKHQLELEHLEKEKNEAVQRVKLEFFTNISHELRTPLTLIKGPLEYLQQRYEKLGHDTVREQFGLMQKNTDYLLRLVNQLLDFRKMDQGKMNLRLYNNDIVKFIKELGEPFQFLSHKRMIDFSITTTHEVLNTWFDPDSLEKIINNLLSNAFKFTPDLGNVSITVSGNQKFEKNETSFIVIKVIDTGRGITADRIPRVFERFHTDKNQKKIAAEGAGIGLSYAKKLVELHQGRIDVDSMPGEGSTFTVTLPMGEGAYENVSNISLQRAAKNDIFLHPSNISPYGRDINDEKIDNDLSKSRSKIPVVLVVDDNTDIRSFLKQALNEYTIFEAENGKEGLELAKKVLPNIILTDILMPVMDGFEFCEKLKTTQETSHIPVVMLTAKSSEESELQGLKTGADDYIRKPFNTGLLKLKLTNIIKHRDDLRKRFNRKIHLQPKDVAVTSTDEKFLNKAIEIIEKHMMDTEFNVEVLLQEMALSRTNLYMKFKELTGLSSSEFIRNIRLKRAMQLLEKSDMSVKEIMYMTGFNTASYFSKCFKKQFGVLPSEYVKQMKKIDVTDRS